MEGKERGRRKKVEGRKRELPENMGVRHRICISTFSRSVDDGGFRFARKRRTAEGVRYKGGERGKGGEGKKGGIVPENRVSTTTNLLYSPPFVTRHGNGSTCGGAGRRASVLPPMEKGGVYRKRGGIRRKTRRKAMRLSDIHNSDASPASRAEICRADSGHSTNEEGREQAEKVKGGKRKRGWGGEGVRPQGGTAPVMSFMQRADPSARITQEKGRKGGKRWKR